MVFNNKLSIYFGEDTVHPFTSKSNMKKVPKLDIIYNNIQIKQHSRDTYLDCILEEIVSGELMSHKVVSKVNAKLKFLHLKNKYLASDLRCLLCNALIQPHFDYACSGWYPNLSEKIKNKMQA